MKRFNRREFLGATAGAAATLHATPLVAKPSPDVVVAAGPSHAVMVKAALEPLGGIGAFVKRGDRVVLKPNISFGNPIEWGCTTHPSTVVAVAQLCVEAGAKDVLVLDYPLQDVHRCLLRSGIHAALQSVPQARLRMLEKHEEFREVAIPGGVTLKSAEIAQAALDADVLINLPQAKAHFSTGVSFGLKNAMGLIWTRKPLHMGNLDQAIADLSRVIRPQLTLLDATRVLLTNGPGGPGDVATPGLVAAGRAVASVDAVGLTLARFNGRQMTLEEARHIVLASHAGGGECDVKKLKVLRVEA